MKIGTGSTAKLLLAAIASALLAGPVTSRNAWSQDVNKNLEMIGQKYRTDIPPLAVELDFKTQDSVTFTMIDGGGFVPDGYSETVKTTITPLAPRIYFVSWQEASGATVTHVPNYEQGLLLSNATLPDGTFINMTGAIQPVATAKLPAKLPVVVSDAKGLVGKTLESRFGDFGVKLTFKAADSLLITPISGPALDQPEQTVSPKITTVRPGLYLTTWQEANKITVTQVLDLNDGKAFSNVTMPDGKFLNLVGTTKIVN